MKRKINYKNEEAAFQPSFSFAEPKLDREKLAGLPPIGRDDKDVRRIVEECDGPKLGLDFEFDPKTKNAYITGVATHRGAAAARFNLDTLKLIAQKAERGVQLVGHSVLGADKPIMEHELGHATPLRWWTDTMLKHYVCNQDWCKVEKGGKEDDAEGGGALGFMNLWAMAAQYTKLWNWKRCAGSRCNGLLCPEHDPLGYCSVDSWAGLECDDQLDKRIDYWQIPQTFIGEIHELSEICLKMEWRGVKISRERVRELGEDMEAAKEKLFKKGEDGEYLEFNPRSSKQGLEWFTRRKINLKSFSKSDIQLELEKRAAKSGYIGANLKEVIKEMEKDDELPADLGALLRLYQYKNAGKGVKPWFDDKYLDGNGLVHPRFIVPGTSTGRLASSKPNFMNIAARGWGELIKSCVVPHDPDNLIVDSDLSQLELRMCVTPETKILTKDLRWIPAGDIKVGDDLIGFDEDQNQGRTGVKYRDSKVLACGRVFQQSITIITDKGAITGAEDHYLVVMRKSKKGVLTRTWVMMKDIVEDDVLPFTSEPWEETKTYDDGYLGGIFDGEGWVSRCGIGFAQNAGLVEREVKKLLEDRGHTFSNWTAKKYHSRNQDAVKVIITSGMWECLRFLGTTRPKRLLDKSSILWRDRRTWGGTNTSHAKVLSVTKVGVKELCAITTSTKTYFANGFFSHNCLYLSGVDPAIIGKDAFTWLVEQGGGLFEEAAKNLAWVPRDLAKITSHAADYMEGLTLLSPSDLMKPTTKKLIEYGALRVYLKKYGAPFDWEYCGKIVAFTGGNLAERLFKNREHESRKKALHIQEDVYFKSFPSIRRWQKEILDFIQENGYTRSRTGRILRLYGQPQDNAKVGVAFHGQGTGADYIQGNMIAMHRMDGRLPLIQVHDSLVDEVPRNWTPKQVREYMSPMYAENWRLPGFACPGKIKIGPNYGDMKALGEL